MAPGVWKGSSMCHWTGAIRPNHLFGATFFMITPLSFSMTLNSLYENKPSKEKSPITDEEETGTMTPMETTKTTKMPWWAHINKRRRRPSPMPPKPHKSSQSEAVKYSQEVPDHIRCYTCSRSSITLGTLRPSKPSDEKFYYPVRTPDEDFSRSSFHILKYERD